MVSDSCGETRKLTDMLRHLLLSSRFFSDICNTSLHLFQSIDEEIAETIARFKTKVDIWVELGLQTSSDTTANVINRGYDISAYRKAASILREHGIPFVTHMIIGLPGEGAKEALDTAREIVESGASGIKIHSIYVMEGTRLAEEYRLGRYTPPTLEEYVETAAQVLRLVGDRLVVHRITGDCPPDMLVAPEWNKNKSEIIDEIRKKMEERGIRQGSLLRGK